MIQHVLISVMGWRTSEIPASWNETNQSDKNSRSKRSSSIMTTAPYSTEVFPGMFVISCSLVLRTILLYLFSNISFFNTISEN